MYQAKVIAPKLNMSSAAMSRVIDSVLDKVGEGAKDDFLATVETWETQPEFTIVRESFTKLDVFTVDRIYFFVNNGTSVRYATMTPDFTPKTSPRIIGSGRGSGGVHYINRNRPRPGIEARKFDETIGEKWKELYPEMMQDAVKEAALAQFE